MPENVGTTPKPYKCETCGDTKLIRTSHYSAVYEHCSKCSDKGEEFGHGKRVFGVLHRSFYCLEQEPRNK